MLEKLLGNAVGKASADWMESCERMLSVAPTVSRALRSLRVTYDIVTGAHDFVAEAEMYADAARERLTDALWRATAAYPELADRAQAARERVHK